MKKLVLCLLALCSFGSMAFAEETFTLTRGFDNKTFFCSDQGGIGGMNKVSVCDCRGNGQDYGQVLSNGTGPSLSDQCRSLTAFGVLSNCGSIRLSGQNDSVGCDCIANGQSYGTVLADFDSIQTLGQTCRNLNAFGRLRACRAL